MMENVESWSRTRRASAHSISMSSESGSEASSVGPSSFTENLTLYLRGDRDHLPLRALRKGEGNIPVKAHQVVGDTQMLQEELEAALKRHDELVTENQRLRDELQQSIASHTTEVKKATSNLVPDQSQVTKHPISRQCQTSDEFTGAEASEAQARLNDANAECLALRTRLNKTEHSFESVRTQLQNVENQNHIQLSRISELETKIAESEEHLQASKGCNTENPSDPQELSDKITYHERADIDELDNQSLIEELEDDIERTRQELDRVIKDKRRVERQLDFVEADLRYERDRNEELERQISKIREATHSNSPLNSDSHPVRHLGHQPELEALKSSLNDANLRIETLEARFSEAIQSTRGSSNEDEHPSGNQVQAIRPNDWRKSTHVDHLVAREETDVYKKNSDEQDLMAELCKVQNERDTLRKQLDCAENADRAAQLRIETLKTDVIRLRGIKERMGRVLMYQWGKEEVGEVQRNRKDGIKERGMGYKYKYFNKDGSTKD